MDSMIEQSIGFKAITSIVVKPLLAALVAFGWWPTADFIILQVNNTVILNPNMKLILEDLKQIFGVLISFAVLVKIFMGIVYIKKHKK